MSAVVLDNEAVQALLHRDHPKRKTVLTMLQGRAQRARRRKDKEQRWVPTTVRVEAGWDRRAPSAAAINSLGVADHLLDRFQADLAAALSSDAGVSPADAHLGATVAAIPDDQDVVVLTSDPDDIARVCPSGTRIVRI
ncbi:MAG: hypothetical protein JWO77_2792 [Ilumatobacteraceae bacterium]|nr:hypothetical protein [Ilumatobacteraceae bacterium]